MVAARNRVRIERFSEHVFGGPSAAGIDFLIVEFGVIAIARWASLPAERKGTSSVLHRQASELLSRATASTKGRSNSSSMA